MKTGSWQRGSASIQWKREVCDVGHSSRPKGKTTNQKVPTAEKGWRIFQTVVSSGHFGLLSALCSAQPPRPLQTLSNVCAPVHSVAVVFGDNKGIWTAGRGRECDLERDRWGSTHSRRDRQQETHGHRECSERLMGETGHALHQSGVPIPNISVVFFPTSRSNVYQVFMELKAPGIPHR